MNRSSKLPRRTRHAVPNGTDLKICVGVRSRAQRDDRISESQPRLSAAPATQPAFVDTQSSLIALGWK